MHILVVEPQPERARVVAAALSAAGLRPEAVATGAAALASLARPAPPDLVVLADEVPDMPILDLLQAAEGMGLALPVVVLGADETAGGWIEAARLGAVDFVQTSETDDAWLALLPARLQAARERRDQGDQAQRLADALASTAAAVIIADRTGAIEVVNEACTRLLGRDVAAAGRATLIELFPLEEEPRVRAEFRAAVDAGGEWAGEIEALAEGAERITCIVTLSPIRRAGGRIDGLVVTLRDVSDRVAMEEALRAANRRLAEQASRDTLTGLYNRGYFHEVLEREMARALRYGDVLSVVMVDLDGFKEINDVHGHAAGDKVLIDIARLLRPHLRDGDILARYGGDEFVVLLPNTDGSAARVVAERLREAVAARGYGPEETSRVTLSAGIATSEDVSDIEQAATDVLLKRADRALYHSKDAGGNVVTPWTPDLQDQGAGA